MASIARGQLWWCDGTALGFEWHLKTRPVLVLEVRGDEVEVAILTSKPHLGNVEVTHRKGTSYLTGKIAVVPREALVDYLDDWSGYPDFIACHRPARGCPLALLTAAIVILLTLCGWSIFTELR